MHNEISSHIDIGSRNISISSVLLRHFILLCWVFQNGLADFFLNIIRRASKILYANEHPSKKIT